MFAPGLRNGAGDVDFYAITVAQGQSVRAEIIENGAATCESSGVDSTLRLSNAAGTSLVIDNNTGRGNCSLIDGRGAAPLHAGAHNLPAGTYYLEVYATGGAAGDTFDYKLDISIQ